jgi:hypothetical protein
MSKHVIIEKTALELAATWYEIGRGQGMTSKWPNARAYARANLEQFIPKALEILTDMLGRNDLSQHMRDEIYDAIMERNNEPTLAILDAPKNQFKLPDEFLRHIKSPSKRTH